MKDPKITVIIPCYNEQDLIGRALDSIPVSKDIQFVIIDDGSTDDSWSKILTWYDNNYEKFSRHSEVHHTENHGVASAMNMGFGRAIGEYIVSLSADDYYLTDFEEFKPLLNGTNDLVYFDLEVNDGSVWHVDEQSKKEFVGAVKFMRREFLGDTRIPDHKYKEDLPFSNALYAKNPREVFTGIVLKHYNFPHEGSLSWQATQDYENDRELWRQNAGL